MAVRDEQERDLSQVAKGAEAIATRQHGLGPRQRSLLILIDGKKNFEDLAKLSAMLGDTAQLLEAWKQAALSRPPQAPRLPVRGLRPAR